ncbi:MAG TPA: hypothetical protein VIL86_17770 [Tepidisphaeraceae bacterium]
MHLRPPLFSLRPLICLLAAALLGCSTKTYTVRVTLINNTHDVLSAGLVKNPVEEHWDGPEHIAIGAPEKSSMHWGKLIQPGQTITLGPQKGSFPRESIPFLRIYRGDLAVEDLVGISRSSPDRLDEALEYENSWFRIVRKEGRLAAEPYLPAPPAKRK